MQMLQLHKGVLKFNRGTVARQLADQYVRMSVNLDMGEDRSVTATPMRFHLDLLDVHYGNLPQSLPQSFNCLILQLPFHTNHAFIEEQYVPAQLNLSAATKVRTTPQIIMLPQIDAAAQFRVQDAENGSMLKLLSSFPLEGRSLNALFPAGVIASPDTKTWIVNLRFATPELRRKAALDR